MSMSLESPPVQPALESGLAQAVLAASAHELQLPISHIKGFVTSLRRLDVDWDEETRRHFLAEIELETDRLTDLVEAWFTNVERGSVS